VPDFLLPDLGEGLDEAEVVAWHVQVGEHVSVDQVIAEVETAKAVVEVPVPFAGIVTKLHAEPGATVSVGRPLISVTANEDAAGFREPGVVTPAAPAGETAATAGDPGAGPGEEKSGSVLIGYGTTSAPARRRRGPRRGAPQPVPQGQAPAAPVSATEAFAPATPAPATPAPATPALAAAAGRDRGAPVAVISPLVRKLARDAGLDLARLPGSGPAGLITHADVRQAIAARTAARTAASAEPAAATPAPGALAPVALAPDALAAPEPPAPAPSIPVLAAPADPAERRIPLRGARRAAADLLTRSRREIPEATVWVDVDATGLVETRRALNARDPDRPVSLMALLARFAVAGLSRYPELNARVTDDAIVIPGHVHLGFAAQTEHGLVVPVVHDAHRLSTRELSARLAERTAAARERRLAPADLAGGTFTVNNYGVFGVDGSAAIINHPEVAILGMGRVIDRPWVVDGQLAVRKVTELTLAFDHRACDGGTAGGFLRYVADCVESPASALGDM
jgi:2-oxoisovalerate dehydrogenase E2 component (dihydrolipoyl transacylase)